MASIDLIDVSKEFSGSVKAVDRLNLTIGDGEFVVLVGPSGCGKSTTLRMVAGLDDLTAGTIRIGDRVVNGVAPRDRDVAMVFQNYALYPHMTVFDNMAFSLKMRRRELRLSRAEIRQRVEAAAQTLGLTELLDRRPRALSGGQRQRVAVGRAIVRSPKAFLFDEPLSNLDAKLRVEMRAELKRLHRRLGTTTIYVTHDQEEAMTLGDRVVVMAGGRVHQCGPPLTVYREPANRFVAGFVGSPAMNFLDGVLCQTADGVGFDEGSCVIPLRGGLGQRAGAFVGRRVVLGFRPEAGYLAVAAATDGKCGRCGTGRHGRFCHACGAEGPPEADAPDRGMLVGRVSVVEPMGESMDVVFGTERHEGLVVRVSARSTVREGAPIAVWLDPRGVHLFEPGEHGRCVVHGLDGAG